MLLQELSVLLLLLVDAVLGFAQTDYILTNERVEVISCDKKYFDGKIRNFKFNRTHTAVNVTFAINTDLGHDVDFLVQGYRFASNEYRLFPIVFRVNICDSIKRNDYGVQNIYRCGNGFHCPIVKGNYTICNWGPDYSKFPPYIPSGRYMLDVKGLYNSSIEILHGQWLVKVETIFNGPYED